MTDGWPLLTVATPQHIALDQLILFVCDLNTLNIFEYFTHWSH
jgi:hypothetical protein